MSFRSAAKSGKSAIHSPCAGVMDSGFLALLGPGMTRKLPAHFLRDRALDEQDRFKRGVVAAKAADDLDAERQAVAVVKAGNIDAGRAHQGPQPVEHRIAGGGKATWRRAR